MSDRTYEQIEIFEEEDVVQLQLTVNAWLALENNLDIQVTAREYVVTAYSSNPSLAGTTKKSYSVAIFYTS